MRRNHKTDIEAAHIEIRILALDKRSPGYILRLSDGLARSRINVLRAALEDLVRRCDGESGVRADGSNIDTLKAHAALAALWPEEWGAM